MGKLHRIEIENSDLHLVHYDQQWLKPEVVEEQYDAKYIGQFCLKNRDGNFVNDGAFVFYQKKPHPRGSNYFAIIHRPTIPELGLIGGVYITNAISVTEREWFGALVGKEVVYSAYRHDYQSHNGAIADGGADYFKSNTAGIPVKFKIQDGKIYLTQKNGVPVCQTSPSKLLDSKSSRILTPTPSKSPRSATTKASSKKAYTEQVTSLSTSPNRALCRKTYSIRSV